MLSIYLSSTYVDLVPYRAAVLEALRRQGHRVVCMEDYGASDQRPLQRCLSDVDRCDIYMAIIAGVMAIDQQSKIPQTVR